MIKCDCTSKNEDCALCKNEGYVREEEIVEMIFNYGSAFLEDHETFRTEKFIQDVIFEYFYNAENVYRCFREYFNCKDVDINKSGNVWVNDPMTGHWLSIEEILNFLDWHIKY